MGGYASAWRAPAGSVRVFTVNARYGAGDGGVDPTAAAENPRHSFTVRMTHWVNAACFGVQVYSGIAILLAYPRFHWSEDGFDALPAFLELPLPFLIYTDIRGPGRSLHFLSAWIFLVNGLVYLWSGVRSGHFRADLIPRRSELRLRTMLGVLATHLRLRGTHTEEFERYNAVQKSAYFAVVFLLLPFMFLSGLAMSPAVTSVLPFLVEILGGHQRARTLHFFCACLLVLFVVVHLLMVFISGFVKRIVGMSVGYADKENH